MPFFFMKESLSVADEIFLVPYLGRVYRGIINFCKRPSPDREPDLAVRGIGSTDSVLVTPRPFGRNARSAESRVVTSEPSQISTGFFISEKNIEMQNQFPCEAKG